MLDGLHGDPASDLRQIRRHYFGTITKWLVIIVTDGWLHILSRQLIDAWLGRNGVPTELVLPLTRSA